MTLFVNLIIVLLCFVIVAAILLQPAKGGAVFGSSQSVFGSSGSTSFLFRVTMVCAFIIMCLSLFLAWSHARKNKNSVIRAENLSSASTAPLGLASPLPTPAESPAASRSSATTALPN